MTDRVRHDPQTRVAPKAKFRIRHRNRSLMMFGHEFNKEPIEGRSLCRLKFCDVRCIEQTGHRPALFRRTDLHRSAEPAHPPTCENPCLAPLARCHELRDGPKMWVASPLSGD